MFATDNETVQRGKTRKTVLKKETAIKGQTVLNFVLLLQMEKMPAVVCLAII